ncbi:unnamed protein product [Linum tenue]|uniref:Uncharacterized protein n=4 Tax=Linum tenue TaxID=586396 RepID=A0AAV0NMX9_9ROSI|nr:unnamed protein product [Linum tenue]
MKDELHSLLHMLRKSRLVALKFLNSSAGYFLLILLAYLFGYFSASSSGHGGSPRQPPLVSPLPPAAATFQLPEMADTSESRTTPTTTASTMINEFRVTTRCAGRVPPEAVRQTVLDRVYDGTSPFQGFPPPHVSGLLHEKTIRGWGSYGAVFANLIRKVRPRVIVEVGTFLGASSIHMAELTRRLGLDAVILCVDDFRGWPGFRGGKFGFVKYVNGDVMLLYQFMQNTVSSNATGSVLPVPFSSGSALQKLCEWGVQADLIEVDAGHDFNSAWADVNRAYRILRPGGVIFGHDYFTVADNRGVWRAVNLFAKLNRLQVRTDGQHWVIDS